MPGSPYVDAILAGTKQPEPLFIRVNTGDCINFNLTSYLPNWHGGDAFVQLAQNNMVGGHIHLVKFDVMGSDGSSNGWNYQEAAFTKEQLRRRSGSPAVKLRKTELHGTGAEAAAFIGANRRSAPHRSRS